MADPALGHEAVFKIAKDGQSLVEFSGTDADGDAIGLSGLRFTPSLLGSPILREGNLDAQYVVVPAKSRQITFSVDDLAITRAIVDVEEIGTKVDWELGRYNDTAGNEKRTGKGVIIDSVNERDWLGKSSFAVTVQVQGAVTVGTY